MKRRRSKPTVILVVLLLAASATTAIAQDAPPRNLDALAARGEALANEDPLATELRNQIPEGPPRRGFDIGMAAAEGQTLPGPGKQKLGASLPVTEQAGFKTAVLFSLERNRNAKLAAIGAKIAQADPAVAEARNTNVFRSEGSVELFVFYRLGFDIAMGIFGDPALGAQGNTAWGPGSQAIRDSLSSAAQSGFNAAVKLRLGQEPPSSYPEPRPRPEKPSKTPPDTLVVDPYGRNSARNKAFEAITDPTAAGPSNEIRCRGYSRTGGSEYVFFTINSRPSPTGETIITYEMGFTPSLKAAGSKGEGLQPGECAFVDRPISERGPYRIRFETVANAQLKQQLHGSPVDTSPTAAERFPDAQTIPAYLQDSNHYWSFFGAKPVNNFFTATGHKFWKPSLLTRPDDPIRLKDNSRRDVLLPKKPE